MILLMTVLNNNTCKHISDYSIEHYSFICTQLNGSKYCLIIPIIPFRHTFKEFQELVFNRNNSFQYYSQLNGFMYYYVSLSIHLDISCFFTRSQRVKILFLKIQH